MAICLRSPFVLDPYKCAERLLLLTDCLCDLIHSYKPLSVCVQLVYTWTLFVDGVSSRIGR